MTEQNVLTNSSGNYNEPAAVYINQLMFARLVEASQTVRHCIPVMLALASRVDCDGIVEVSQAKLACECNITLQKVKKAIAGLTDAGLISSVEVSAEPVGTITRFLNPDLVRTNNPDGEV
jgi:transcription initiation factor IIE alpha subunit